MKTDPDSLKMSNGFFYYFVECHPWSLCVEHGRCRSQRIKKLGVGLLAATKKRNFSRSTSSENFIIGRSKLNAGRSCRFLSAGNISSGIALRDAPTAGYRRLSPPGSEGEQQSQEFVPWKSEKAHEFALAASLGASLEAFLAAYCLGVCEV